MAQEGIMEERLSKRNLWGYSLGGVGRDMVYALVNAQLFTCALLTKGLTAANMLTMSLIIIICRIFDACNDPLMGAIIEVTRTKWGKFKPWIMIGCITNIGVVLALFLVPLYGDAYVIFFIFAYLLWGITFTMNDISYWGMMPSLTSNEKDRNNISTLSNITAGIGNVSVTLLFPILAYGDHAIGNSAQTGSIVMAIIFCVMFFGCQLMTSLVVKEKPLAPSLPNAPKPSLKKMFKVLFKNDQVLWIALTMLLYNPGGAILTSAMLSIFLYIRFGYQGMLVTIFVVLSGMSAVVMVFYPLIAKKFSRKQISTVSVIIVVVSYTIMLFIGLFAKTSATLFGYNIIFYLLAISGLGASLGQTMFYMVQTVSMQNCVEYNEWKTGERAEGAIFSLRPFMAKMSSAIVQGIVSLTFFALAITDVTQEISNIENDATLGLITAEEKSTQIASILATVPESTSKWLIVVLTVAPMLFIVAGLIVYLAKFKLTEKTYAQICKEIEERNVQETSEDETTSDEIVTKESPIEENID